MQVKKQQFELDKNKGESESCSVMSDTLQPHGLYSAWNSPGQNTGLLINWERSTSRLYIDTLFS